MSQPPDPSELRRVTPWTEERVDQLLTWYFSEKAALAEEALTSSIGKPLSLGTSEPIAGRRSGRWLAWLCSVLLVCSGWIISETLPVETAARTMGVVVLETTSVPTQTEDSVVSGTDGQYAIRNVWRWKSTSYFESATGNMVERSTPELLIDIEMLALSPSESQP